MAAFSLLSKNAVVAGAWIAAASAKPKLLPGLAIQPLTCAVTSTATNWAAAPTGTSVPLPGPPSTGALLALTNASAHGDITVCNSTVPGVPTRFTHSSRLALTSLAGVTAAGKVDRSNCINAVEPPPTLSVGKAPKFRPGCWLLMCASALSGASSAKAPADAPASASKVKVRRTGRESAVNMGELQGFGLSECVFRGH